MRLKWHVGKQCEQTAVCVTSVARARGTTSANARSTLFDFFFFASFPSIEESGSGDWPLEKEGTRSFHPNQTQSTAWPPRLPYLA